MAETKTIAGFELLEKVGQGGMGAVFKARQVSMQRDVALKILQPKLATNEAFKARFLREARLCAKLNHPNIINGIDCGEDGKYTFFAMEFVDGHTVRQIMKKQGRLPLKEAVEILRQMVEALIYINKNNMVHRDIKPDNIMLDSMGIAKLCDLGLAKLSQNTDEGSDADGAATDDPALTRAGQVVGTPYYIAPEVATGEKNVDIRADIYCLGATFYHIATGWVPFEGKRSKEVMCKHITDEAPGLRERSKDIPECWGWIVSKMMAKSPGDRYRDPKELLEDIDAASAGNPVKAASFKAKTSCAVPNSASVRTTKRVVNESKPAIPRAPSSTGTKAVSAVGARSATASGRYEPETRSARAVRNSDARRNDTGMMVGLAAGGAVALIALVVLGGGGGSESTLKKKPAPSTGSAMAEPFHYEHDTAPLRQAPSYPSPEPVQVAAAPRGQTPPAAVPDAVHPDHPPGAGSGKAQQSFNDAQELEKKSPDNFAELLPAYSEASMLAEHSTLAPQVRAAQQAVLERWGQAFDAAVKPMHDLASELRAKEDFPGAIAAINADKVPENIRAGEWGERLEKLRADISDAAENKAAKFLKEAEAKASAGDSKSLAEAIELYGKAESAGPNISRSASRAESARKKLAAALDAVRDAENAARNEKLAAASEHVPKLLERLAPSLKRGDFAAALDALNKAGADKQFADVPALIEKVKEDIAALQELRKAAIDSLRTNAGQTVKLSRGGSVVSGVLSDAPQARGVALKVGGADMVFTPEQLDAADVDARLPQASAPSSEDLRRRGLLYMAAGNAGRARDYFNRARDAGLKEPLEGTLRYLDVLEFGPREMAARDAWEKAEKLFTDKKLPELKIAYTAFQKDFSGTKACTEQTALIRQRVAEIDATLAIVAKADPAQPDNAANAPNAAPAAADVLFLTDYPEIDSHVGVKFLGKNGQMIMKDPPTRITVGGEESPHGLFTYPPQGGRAYVLYHLPSKQYKSLKGSVAIDDASKGLKSNDTVIKGKVVKDITPLEFSIVCDGKPVWHASVTDVGAPEAFDVDISNATKVELRVDCKANNSGAYAVWVEPRLSK